MTADRPLAAAFAVIGGMALLGLIDNLVPRIAAEIGLWQFHALRAAMALPLLVAAAWIAGWRLAPLRPARVAARSALAAGAMGFYFAALGFLPVPLAAAGLFTSPIFVLVLSWGLAGMRVGAVRLASVALGFLGILLILRPGAVPAGAVSVLPVLAGALWGSAAFATRRICAGESAAALLAGFFAALGVMGLAGLVVLALLPQVAPAGAEGFLLRGWVWPGATVWALVALQAAGSLAGVGLLIVAYGWGEAAQVTVFEYSLLVFAVFWAWMLRGEVVDALAAMGMALVAVSGVTAALGRGR